MDNETRLTTGWTHRDHAIKIKPGHNDAYFEITGPIQEGSVHPNRAESFKAATQQIDNYMTEQGKRAKASINLTADVVDDKGEGLTVRGINMRDGKLQFVEAYDYTKNSGTTYVWPSVPWVVVALKRREELWAEIRTLNERLHPLQINISRSYGQPTMANYQNYATKFMEEYNTAIAAANSVDVDGVPFVKRKTG